MRLFNFGRLPYLAAASAKINALIYRLPYSILPIQFLPGTVLLLLLKPANGYNNRVGSRHYPYHKNDHGAIFLRCLCSYYPKWEGIVAALRLFPFRGS
jgi:hypothetical protein